MNILFIIGKYPGYGGVETVTTVLANSFVELGDTVAIASFEVTDEKAVEGKLNSNVRLLSLNYPVNSKSNVRFLSTYIKENNIDFIINQWAVPWYVTRMIKRSVKGSDAKLITVHHNQPDTNARIQQSIIAKDTKRGLSKLVNEVKLNAIKTVSRLSLRYVYSKSDKFVVLSPSFIPLLHRFIWKEIDSKSISISNPLTISSSKDNVKENLIIVVGRIEYNQKRCRRAVDLWANLQDDFPDWKMIFVGDGPDKKDLDEYITSNGIKRVEVTGFTDPIPYYKRAKVLLMTSEYEGFGLVIVEGMANEVVPVVVDSYAALSDIIDDGDNGVKLPYPFDLNISVSKLKGLIDEEKKLSLMASKGYEDSTRFSLSKIIEQWNKLFIDMKK